MGNKTPKGSHNTAPPKIHTDRGLEIEKENPNNAVELKQDLPTTSPQMPPMVDPLKNPNFLQYIKSLPREERRRMKSMLSDIQYDSSKQYQMKLYLHSQYPPPESLDMSHITPASESLSNPTLNPSPPPQLHGTAVSMETEHAASPQPIDSSELPSEFLIPSVASSSLPPFSSPLPVVASPLPVVDSPLPVVDSLLAPIGSPSPFQAVSFDNFECSEGMEFFLKNNSREIPTWQDDCLKRGTLTQKASCVMWKIRRCFLSQCHFGWMKRVAKRPVDDATRPQEEGNAAESNHTASATPRQESKAHYQIAGVIDLREPGLEISMDRLLYTVAIILVGSDRQFHFRFRSLTSFSTFERALEQSRQAASFWSISLHSLLPLFLYIRRRKFWKLAFPPVLDSGPLLLSPIGSDSSPLDALGRLSVLQSFCEKELNRYSLRGFMKALEESVYDFITRKMDREDKSIFDSYALKEEEMREGRSYAQGEEESIGRRSYAIREEELKGKRDGGGKEMRRKGEEEKSDGKESGMNGEKSFFSSFFRLKVAEWLLFYSPISKYMEYLEEPVQISNEYKSREEEGVVDEEERRIRNNIREREQDFLADDRWKGGVKLTQLKKEGEKGVKGEKGGKERNRMEEDDYRQHVYALKTKYDIEREMKEIRESKTLNSVEKWEKLSFCQSLLDQHNQYKYQDLDATPQLATSSSKNPQEQQHLHQLKIRWLKDKMQLQRQERIEREESTAKAALLQETVKTLQKNLSSRNTPSS